MKKLIYSLLVLSLSAGAAFATDAPAGAAKKAAAKQGCGDCPMARKASAKKCSGKMCPEKIAGVETSARNISNGVEITMTARTKETVAQLQELALVHYGSKETMDPACPGRVPGTEIKLENTTEGARVTMTGKTPEVIKKIQAASAKEHLKTGCPDKAGHKKEAKASKKYTCPMNCAQSDSPGKCPKCGMPMEKK